VKVRWTFAARDDLDGAISHLAERNPDAAEALLDRILDAADLLADGRFDGPPAELEWAPEARGWLIAPFRLYYRRELDVLVVLRLYHVRQRPL